MTQQEECLSQGKHIDEWEKYLFTRLNQSYDSFETFVRGGARSHGTASSWLKDRAKMVYRSTRDRRRNSQHAVIEIEVWRLLYGE